MTVEKPKDRRQRPSAVRPPASLSLDLDNKWAYYKTRGDTQWQEFPSYLEWITPRILEVLDRHRLTITFFVVGQDAALDSHREVLASITQAGHEVANHSFHHEYWLHMYSEKHVNHEFALAEEHIERATGQRPVGFRGPAYSLSEATLHVLVRRGYRYDASTLPTFIGPLARAYILYASRLSTEDKAKRAALFGGVREVMRPITPYYWDFGEDRLLEIPVSTIPFFRLPFHFNYVVYLSRLSRRLARTYFHTALHLCRTAGVAPSLLLGPLDFMGGDEDGDLSWCPGMSLSAQHKLDILEEMLSLATRHFSFGTMIGQAEAATAGRSLALIKPTFSHQKGDQG